MLRFTLNQVSLSGANMKIGFVAILPRGRHRWVGPTTVTGRRYM